MQSRLWGVDLGGTKLEAVVLENGAVLARKRLETQAERGYKHIISRVTELIEQIEKEVGARPKRIGFGTPGVLDPKTKLMKNCNTQCLNGTTLNADLEAALGVRSILANDANCFALAESKEGAAVGAASVFGVIMGTGVGGGVVINGQVLNGAQGIAGEWGHNVLRADGAQCYCGKRGCVEGIISGPSIERIYATLTGEKRTLAEIYSQYKANNHGFAAQLVDQLCEDFAQAIAYVINILDPEVIVLGGGVSNIEELYTRTPMLLKKWVFNNCVETKIVRNKLGDSAGVFGAAWLVATTT